MSNPYDIGGIVYGPKQVLDLRQSIIEHRDRALGPENFDAALAILLSHAIGVIAALARDKWPDIVIPEHKTVKHA